MRKWLDKVKLRIEKLSEKHLPLVDAFSCVENKEMLVDYNSKTRKRIIKHSNEMDMFIKNEALEEQNNKLNTTHLLIDEENNRLLAYLSLCSDNLLLDIDEKRKLSLPYQSIPSLKIARLAVSIEHRNKGIGKLMLDYAAYIGSIINDYCGITFITLDCYKHRILFYEQNGFVKNKFQKATLSYDSPISMRISLNEYLESIESVNHL